MLDTIVNSEKVVGTKQTMKMIRARKAKRVYLAKDVDLPIFLEIEELCKQNQVPIQYVKSMLDLGKACGIHRKTATVAVLTD